jgi:hypothetical protein
VALLKINSIVFPAVPINAHLIERLSLPGLVAPQVSRHQIVGVIGATLLGRNDVVSREGNGIFPGQAEVNLLTADSTEHARIAQLGPVGKVTHSVSAAHEASVADQPARGQQFGQPEAWGVATDVDHGSDELQKLIMDYTHVLRLQQDPT